MKGTPVMKRVIMKYGRVKSKSPICLHFLFLCPCAKGPILCLGSIRSCSPNWWQVCQSTRSERYMWNNISPRGKLIRNLYYWRDLESRLTYKVQILCGVTFFCFAGHAVYLWRNHPWCDHQPPCYPQSYDDWSLDRVPARKGNTPKSIPVACHIRPPLIATHRWGSRNVPSYWVRWKATLSLLLDGGSSYNIKYM